MAQIKTCMYCGRKYAVSNLHKNEAYTCAGCEKKWRMFEAEYWLAEFAKQEAEKKKAY